MKGKSGDLNGFLDKGSVFRGELEFEDTLRVDGRFNGKITSKNELIVGETAHVEGEVHVGRIAISGTVEGTLIADDKIEIHRSGKVYGKIQCPVLVVEEGAIIQGDISMGAKRENRPVPIEGLELGSKEHASK